MKKIFCFALLVCCFFVSHAQECDLKYKTAQDYKNKSDYKNAVIWYKKILNSSCGDFNGKVKAELKECEKKISDMTVAFLLEESSSTQCKGQGGIFVLELKKAPAYWTVLKTPEWLQVSSVNLEEKKVIFNVKANPNAEIRKGTIRLKSDKGKTQDFTVFQNQGDEHLNVQAEELSFGGGGGQQTLTVTANFKWTYDVSASWLRLEKQNDILLVTCSANDLREQRNATIVISGKDVSQNIMVTQYEGDNYFSVSGIENHTIGFEASGGENNKLKISCNEEWIVKCECPWIKVLSAGKSVIVQCEANPWAENRTGSFEVVTSSGNQTRTIIVEQTGASPRVDRIFLPYKGAERKVYDARPHYRMVKISGDRGNMQVKVHSNVQNWNCRIIPDDVNWITAEAYQKDSLIILTIADNNERESREASVMVSAMGIQDTLLIRQSKRGYQGLLDDYFEGSERVWKTTRFFVDVYALEPIGFRIGGLAKRWKFVEFSLLDFDIEYAHKCFYLDWEPIVRGYLPLSRNDHRWAVFMGMGISVNMLNLSVDPKVEFSYLGKPHFLFEVGAEYHWKKRDNISSRIFFRYDGFASFGFSFDIYKWTKKWKE